MWWGNLCLRIGMCCDTPGTCIRVLIIRIEYELSILNHSPKMSTIPKIQRMKILFQSLQCYHHFSLIIFTKDSFGDDSHLNGDNICAIWIIFLSLLCSAINCVYLLFDLSFLAFWDSFDCDWFCWFFALSLSLPLSSNVWFVSSFLLFCILDNPPAGLLLLL